MPGDLYWDDDHDGGAGDSAGADAVMVAMDTDLPEPTVPLPADIVPELCGMRVTFSMCRKIDLKKLAFGARNAEYNPRCRDILKLRLVRPPATVSIFRIGSASMVVPALGEADVRRAARKVARIVQKCGHPDAKFEGFRSESHQFKADLRFPVRLESVQEKWKQRAIFIPEVSATLCFFVGKPRCTVQVSATGKLSLRAASKQDAQEVLRGTYGIFREFSV